MTHVAVAEDALWLWRDVQRGMSHRAVVVVVVVHGGRSVHRRLDGESVDVGRAVLVEQEGRGDHGADEGAQSVETVHGLEDTQLSE